MHIRDIAKILKISASTVSRALNPETEKMISEKTRKRIQEFAHRSNFVPNRSARELSTGRTHTIGILLPTTFDSYFFNDHLAKVLEGAYKVLALHKKFNCKLIVLPKGNLLPNLEREVHDNRIDGLLLSSCSDHAFSSSHYFPKQLLSKWNRPIVVIGLNLKGTRFNCVYSSNFEAAERAVTHLIRKGHKTIAMIDQMPSVPDSKERVDAYKKVLAEHKIKIDPALIIGGNLKGDEELPFHPALLEAPGHNTYPLERGYKVTLQLFQKKGPKPTAIFCANDETAFGALKALRVLGLNCPQKVAIMGFDGLDAGELVDPQLSTVAQPSYEMSLLGTQILLDILEGKIKEPVAKFVPMALTLRDSA